MLPIDGKQTGCTPKALSLRRGVIKQQWYQLRNQLALAVDGSGSPAIPAKKRRKNTASSKGKAKDASGSDESGPASTASKRKLAHYQEMDPEYPDYSANEFTFGAVKTEVKTENEDFSGFYDYNDYQPGFTPPPSTPGFSRAPARSAPERIQRQDGTGYYEDDDEGDLGRLN